MEYQVPQFIEVEDRVVGPLTLRQFIYLAGTGGLCVVAFIYLPIYLAALIILPLAALGAVLSFYKVNGKPFIDVLEAGFNYYTGAKLFLWKHEVPTLDEARAMQAKDERAARERPLAARRPSPRLTRGKLSELAWSLDVQKPSEAPGALES